MNIIAFGVPIKQYKPKHFLKEVPNLFSPNKSLIELTLLAVLDRTGHIKFKANSALSPDTLAFLNIYKNNSYDNV